MDEVIYTSVKRIEELLLASRNRDGNIQVESIVNKGDAYSDAFCLTSPDYGDKSTWFQNSVQETGITLTANEAKTVYTVPNSKYPIINIWSNRLSLPYKYIRTGLAGNVLSYGGLHNGAGSFDLHTKYDYTVYKDGSPLEKTAYTVDFLNGTFTFETSQGESVITADFSHIGGVSNCSDFVLSPPEGHKWTVQHNEIQFSESVTAPIPSLSFEMWGGREDRAYEFNNPEHQTYYMLYQMVYKSPQDYINVCNDGKNFMPKFAGLQNNVLIFPFYYINSISLGDGLTAPGMIVRIRSLGDVAFQNTEIATISFYIEDRILLTAQ